MTPAARELALLRLVAQRLAGPAEETPTDAVRWMTAMQAQDYPGALTSVALRSSSRLRSHVEDALLAGYVVRSWPMRGTLHLVAAEDLPWMLDVLAHRVVARSASRRAQLGIDGAALTKAGDTAVDAVHAAGQLSRRELFAAWERRGLATSAGRGSHLLGYLAQTGTLCFGPVRGGEQLVVLIEEWIPSPRRLGRQEALSELATRYFCSHGPATVKDFARWSYLTAADARAGLAMSRQGLASLDVDGVEYLMSPETPDRLADCRSSAQRVLLLPGFDEFILGYADRTAQLPAEFADCVVPGGNGMFKSTVVSDGVVVATWKHGGRGAQRTIETTALVSPLVDRVSAAISQVFAGPPWRG